MICIINCDNVTYNFYEDITLHTYARMDNACACVRTHTHTHTLACLYTCVVYLCECVYMHLYVLV